MIFKREKLLYCQKCGVCFQKRDDNYGKTHCWEHAREWLENERRAGIVRDWALRNWEKLEPQMLDETKAAREAMYAGQQSQMNYMAQLAQAGNYQFGVLGGLGGLNQRGSD